MSLTVPSSAPAIPTPSCANFNQIPTTDSACALPPLSNATSILEKCCKDAPIEKYPQDCGFYCLAADQTIGDLIDCLQSNGAGYTNVICRGDRNATATGEVTPKSTTSKGQTTGASATRTGASAGPSETGAAAGLVFGGKGVSKAGLGFAAMVVVSLFAGTML